MQKNESRGENNNSNNSSNNSNATTACFRTDLTIATADPIEKVLLYSAQVKGGISSVERAHTIHSTPSDAYLPTAGLEGGPLGRKGGAELEDDDHCKAVSSLQEARPTYGSGAGSLLKKR